jgi:hypothetical protein
MKYPKAPGLEDFAVDAQDAITQGCKSQDSQIKLEQKSSFFRCLIQRIPDIARPFLLGFLSNNRHRNVFRAGSLNHVIVDDQVIFARHFR